MGRALKWGVTLALIFAVVWWLTRDKPIEVTITHATVGEVASTISNTRAGTVTACKRARLSLPIGGQIEQINVEEGQLVAEGEVLLSLWNLDKKALLAEAVAKSNALKLAADSVCIAARQDRKEASRQQTLYSRSLTAQETVDATLAKAEAAESSCKSAQANHSATESMVGVIKAQLAQTYLKAPFAGIVAEVTGEVGEYTTPSPPGVATPPAIDLLTHDCHFISAPIDEVDAAYIQLGMPVNISIDAFKGTTFIGRVQRISPYVQDFEKQARTVTVEVEISEHKSPHLLAGYSADVEIILQKTEGVLRIPSELLIEKSYVLVLNDADIIEKRVVEVGLSNWNKTEIRSGLSEQDRIVSSIGKLGVEEGARAKVVVHD